MINLTHLRKNIFLKPIILTVLTIFCVFSCDCVYVYAMNNDNMVTKYERLEKENQRLETMISQYHLLVRSLNNENEKLKTQIVESNSSEVVESNSSEVVEETKTYLGDFTITYYCTENYYHTCGGGGTTASGTQVTPYQTAAVDTRVIPFGTKLYIEGIGYRIAEDRGGAVKGNKIDLAVTTHKEALNLGVDRNVKVYIVE